MYIIIIIHKDSGYQPYLVEHVELENLKVITTLASRTYDAKLFNSDDVDLAVKLVKQDYTVKSGYTVKKFKVK